MEATGTRLLSWFWLGWEAHHWAVERRDRARCQVAGAVHNYRILSVRLPHLCFPPLFHPMPHLLSHPPCGATLSLLLFSQGPERQRLVRHHPAIRLPAEASDLAVRLALLHVCCVPSSRYLICSSCCRNSLIVDYAAGILHNPIHVAVTGGHIASRLSAVVHFVPFFSA